MHGMTPNRVKLIRNLAELPDTLRGGAVAIGNFDGVHLGHAAIVGAARGGGPRAWAGRRWCSRSIRIRCGFCVPRQRRRR